MATAMNNQGYPQGGRRNQWGPQRGLRRAFNRWQNQGGGGGGGGFNRGGWKSQARDAGWSNQGGGGGGWRQKARDAGWSNASTASQPVRL